MDIVCLLLLALVILLLVYVVFSWIPRPPEPILPFARAVQRIVSPVLEPIRRVVPPVQLGGVSLDLSVLIVFVVVSLIQGALC